VQIHWRTPHAVSERERAAAEEQLLELARDHSDLIDVWIDIEESTHHRHGGDEVRIRAQARGAELLAQREADEAGIALREALEAFVREVREMRDRRAGRRVERPPSPPHLGLVDRVFRDRGFGFLLTDAGEQVYFHRNALQGDLDFDRLEEGQRVALNYEPGEKGPQATFVSSPPPDAPTP
jgi:cold shock CspA family protein/ribosome-associated translation inhibitor RaiA